MSAEKFPPFERDYIRLTERFKALSTFAQFLQGIHRAFLPIPGGRELDLGSLYEDVKSLGGRIHQIPRDRVEAMIREIEARLETAAVRLREADMELSPSLTRRYFERVRPADERIPFYLLRFYLGQAEMDDNLLDKIDYLATVCAAGTADPGAPASRTREEIQALFQKLVAGASPTATDNEAAPEIAKAFDELSTEIAATVDFDDLAAKGWVEGLRTMKRRVARGMSHPEILAAAVGCNLTARAVFQRLYMNEEITLHEAADRITELEHQAFPMEGEIETALRRFRDSQSAVESQTAEGTVRWRQLLELHQATAEAMKLVSSWSPESQASWETPSREEGLPFGEHEDPFWEPCLRPLLAAVETGSGESAAAAAFDLESWETEAARRSIAGRELTKPETAVRNGAALRIKAESELEAVRGGKEAAIPPEVLREARVTLSHVSEIDRTIGELVGVERPPGTSDEDVRRWMRTRLRLLHAASALWLELDRPS